MSQKLVKAFQFTDEESADAFERFANAFLVDDYPEMTALGGKKDKGMDACLYSDDTGKPSIVAQSCVSPASKARTKIVDTFKKLKAHDLIPAVFIYCTSANIGTALDETKKELRRDFKTTLEVCDAPWFVARHQTSQNRAALCDTYSREVLEPFLREVQPDKLYSFVLEKAQQRVAIQYLEAVNSDRSKDGNLTKGLFDGLIACVTRDSNPPLKAYAEAEIVSAISAMFPAGHGTRIKEIVPGRIQHLVNKKALHFDRKAGGYVLSFDYRKKFETNIQKAQERELVFIAALRTAVNRSAEELGVDYEFSLESIVQLGQQVVFWYLREQGKALSDPQITPLNILNAEKLLDEFLLKYPLNTAKLDPLPSEEQVNDLLPSALFSVLNSEEQELQHYLRAKADLFIVHGFLQVTPDIQQACARLLGHDVLYLDTTILIRCLAEHYSTGKRTPLLNTIEAAKRVGYQIRTWKPYINELVSHLRNRVLKEWINHYKARHPEELRTLLRAARTLVRVFCERAERDGKQLSDYVTEVIGESNYLENAAEFLKEVFGIVTEDLPAFDDEDGELRERVEKAWLEEKRRPDNIEEDRFLLLVKNDVDSYVSIINQRRTEKPEGPNYGHKVWYLSLDRTPWRVARVLSPECDPTYDVAMSLSYLMNCVATLAITGKAEIPEELIPATTILEESYFVPGEIRAAFESEVDFNEKPFLQIRRVRDLTHKLKSSKPMTEEPLDVEVDLEATEEESEPKLEHA